MIYKLSDLYTDIGVPTTTEESIPDTAERAHYSDSTVTTAEGTKMVNKNMIFGTLIIMVSLVMILHYVK